MKMMGLGEKSMIKPTIIMIAIVALLLSSAAFYYANQLQHADNSPASVLTRKEDILATQQRLAQQIEALNQTIQTELDNQKALNDKVVQLSAKADIPPPVINTTRTVQADPIIVPVPQPRPVTRAS